MKVIQGPCDFSISRPGGGVISVRSLAQHLQKRGIRVVAVFSNKTHNNQNPTASSNDGISIRRLSVNGIPSDIADLYGMGDFTAASHFGQILDEERPHLVHLHTFNRFFSLRLLKKVKQRRIPVVFTYKEPKISCLRGTLVRWGKEICDGALDLDLCTRCNLHGLGLPQPLADVVGRIPVAVGSCLGKLRPSGKIWTALRMRELVWMKHVAFKAFISEVDHITVQCEWTKELLIRNGVAPFRISLLRHGLTQEVDPPSTFPIQKLSSTPRIAFLGRDHPEKGAHLLIQAMRRIPHVAISLDLYHITRTGSSSSWLRHLQKLALGDSRVTFYPYVSPDTVVKLLRGYDLLVVPSQVLETGPMVVFEAFAAGIPVIGSNLGGIAELVKHEINGLLVEPFHSVEAWRKTLQRVVQEKGLLERLCRGISFPKRMEKLAMEMEALYQRLIPVSKRKASYA